MVAVAEMKIASRRARPVTENVPRQVCSTVLSTFCGYGRV